MKTIRSLSLLAAGVLATAAWMPAHAVELKQKFNAGESLNYDLSMNGTTNIKVPTDVPVFFAGVPLEIEVNGKAIARINTLAVDQSGDATIFVEVPTADVNGRAFGQKAKLELRDGQSRLLLNGKAIALPQPDPDKMPQLYGLVIGKDGRVKSLKELDKTGKLPAAQANVSRPAAPQLRSVADKPGAVSPADAVDKGAFISAMVLQALPTLWPQGDVQPGDTWKTTLPLPPAFARNADVAKGAAPLSEWTMTLKGEEVVDGVSLWRVGVVGGIQVDGQSLPKPDVPKANEKPVPELENLSQRVDGDLWIDAQQGRIVRGDMVVDARGQSHTVDNKGRSSDPAWADFTGTFGLRLQPKN